MMEIPLLLIQARPKGAPAGLTTTGQPLLVTHQTLPVVNSERE